MVPTTRRARRGFAAELPTDVLFHVLLPLSAKELCRLRVVCREWRSLTSDPHFIRAHAARHPPLFVASFLLPGKQKKQMQMRIDLIDLSGKTVKRIADATDRGQVLCPRLGLVFVANKSDNTCRVLDPAAPVAGSPVVAPRFRRLPVLPAPAHRGSRRRLREAATTFAIGRVAATGEHKVLRIFDCLKDDDDDDDRPYLFEVLTLGVGDRRRRGRARWRDVPSPDMFVCPDSSVVVDGVVYFLRSAAYNDGVAAALQTAYQPSAAGGGGIVVPPADCVASFDLEREEWRKRLQGPISMGMHGHDYDGGGGDDSSDDELDDDHWRQFDELDHPWCRFALAELKGCLVLVQHLYVTHLWILTDFERGIWVKEYNISVHSIRPPYLHRAKPLFVLDDGRLVAQPRVGQDLAVYDPRTDTWEEWEPDLPPLGAVDIYAGSLLGLHDAW